jgi:outer membrane murein-binding lipoprotein Lpp
MTKGFHNKFAFCALVAVFSTVALAQPSDPAQLKSMYDDAMKQLQAAQDRRNELASENEKLKAEIARLERDLVAQREDIRRSYILWSNYQAWAQFIEGQPALLERFRAFFIEGTPSTPATQPDSTRDREGPPTLYDPQWPFSAISGGN